MRYRNIELRIDSGQLREYEALLKAMPQAANQAARQAINRTLSFARTRVVRAASAAYTLPAKTIRAKVHITRPQSGAWPEGRIKITASKGVPLVEFQHKPRLLSSELRRRPKHGVAVRVLRKGAYQQIAGAFKARGEGRGRPYIGWRARRGGRPVGRYPVHQLYGPSMATIGANAIDAAEAAVAAHFERRFEISLQFVLQKGG